MRERKVFLMITGLVYSIDAGALRCESFYYLPFYYMIVLYTIVIRVAWDQPMFHLNLWKGTQCQKLDTVILGSFCQTILGLRVGASPVTLTKHILDFYVLVRLADFPKSFSVHTQANVIVFINIFHTSRPSLPTIFSAVGIILCV